jgi:KipI family sensor histidine kinase inhibitor
LPAPSRLNVVPYGERALLARVPGEPRAVARAAEALRAAEPSVDVGCGARSLLVVAGAPIDLLRRAELTTSIGRAFAAAQGQRAAEPRRHVIDVVYDGPDLDDVAAATSLTRDEVILAHAAREVTVEVVGFLPGFAYLGAIDPRLQLPRRASPRTRVPAGSVAVAGRYTGIYPGPSPGGWHLLGRTRIDAFDPSREPPGLFVVGDVVRFQPVDSLPELAPSSETAGALGSPALRGLALEKVAALVTIQDGGRARWLDRGVPASGATDPVALAAANLAVGNDPAAAALEIAGGSCRLVARGDLLCSIDGEPALLLREAASLDVKPTSRLSSYLAVRGGVAVDEVLGSRATAVTAGLGAVPRPLRAGDVIPVGDDPGTRIPDRALVTIPGPTSPLVLRFDALPATAPLSPRTLEALLGATFTVSRAVDRVGVRLDGPALPREPEADAPPEPVLPGAIQITSDGRPIVLGPDAAVTGGYPVIGVLRKTSLWSLYRLQPGHEVRFARAPVMGAAVARG